MRHVPALGRAVPVLLVALLLGLAVLLRPVPAPAAAATARAALPQLLAPGTPPLYLDWSWLLPSRPVPYRPSTESACADGSDRCIEATIATMRRRLDALGRRCDHDAVFALAYLRVTEEVRRAVRAGAYADRRWINHQDAVFAQQYFRTYADWHEGHRDRVPRAWRIAFAAADDRSVSGLGDFVLSMNAHINRDMPFVLAGIGLTAPDGRSHKPDHDVFNRRLAALYVPVLREIAARFDPTADDLDAGPLDDAAAAALLQTWREVVWRNAEALSLARGPAERARVAARIETYAETQGVILRALLGSSGSAARDAWCAAHGRG